ncbi:HET-domain-containing protein, partial [Zopfia rhizophila CBS 207.26]
DLSIPKTWLKSCQSLHTENCCKPRASLTTLRFIDCMTRCIVSAGRQEYVTLSYTWGKLLERDYSKTADSKAFATRLPERLPQTIEHSIEVTKELRFRYLWVDRYCINQNDPEDVHTQICQMDLIFSNSALTIVAAAGTNPTYGLPGINHHSRISHASISVKVGRHVFVSKPRNPRWYINKSAWMSRGWTYQEALLSNRRLIFTEQQLYFECRRASCKES